ncbi:CRISPR system Cascade subunit CasE [Murinocardiopsis flavida]|uniref:CRISPR system Cascade subunit CasE n=1 Tax=Murinocardiopsis flavida TaxID=645275 RepID=A0A2P8CWQ3_9ACTN|nr:type I-E CRISPR-associated protein Cas6/Cse3/CasE [Murinocardiopsis flavida]PSK89414.1 CRISPR system Cascade subunit CasE [Murinocardiopsis flavida]
MYLSRLPLNTASRAFRRDFADVQQMHRTLMGVLPEVVSGEPARREHGLLWRLDVTDTGYLLLVQSGARPDWERLPSGYLAGEAQTRPMDGVLEAIAPGRALAFRLTANPTRIVRDPDAPKEERGKRVALHDPKEQLGWLARKGEQCGFVVPAGGDGGMAVNVSPCPPVIGYKGEGRSRNKITISAARYDGRLVVTDPEAFAEALRTGIGRAKAYGCGLLSLAPVRA